MYLIIFGASGDLAKRKLFPALSKLNLENVEIIAFARTHYDRPFSEILNEFYSYEDESFCNSIRYIKGKSYTDLEAIKSYLNSDSIIYLSLPPEIYFDTLTNLSNYEYKSIAIEKPFGADYQDFKKFKSLQTEKLYFIDHFLLKPLIVSWPKLINNNNKLKKMINKNHIKHIKVVFKEEIGGEGRSYFDTHGLLKDVVQNHLSEIIAVFATEQCPVSCEKQGEERVEFFKHLKIVEELSTFGQYNEYCHEMNKQSSTETFSLVTLEANIHKWKGLPFILVAGKGMNEKKTEFIFEIQKESFEEALDLVDGTTFENIHLELIQNIRIVCNLYPLNEVYLEIVLEAKTLKHKIFSKAEIQKYMEEKYGNYENHEIVFDSFIKNKPFDVVKFCEAELLWNIFGCVIKKEKPLFNYSKGSDLPKEVEELLEKIYSTY